MIKPKRLNPGSTIGIISPSYWIDNHILEEASKIFSDRNYKLVFGKTIHSKKGPFAGSAKIRAEDIHTMFLDPSIDAIVCARGGYGANKVIPLLDYELIKNHPKIFIGYSDITAYLISITQRTKLITFHGPMLTTYKYGFEEYALKTNAKKGSDNSHFGLEYNRLFGKLFLDWILEIKQV